MLNAVFKNVKLSGNITDITVREGRIVSVQQTDDKGLDMGGLIAYPGLIDVHSHGMVAHDTMMADGLHEMSAFLYSNGITSWYPTTMSADFDDLYKAVQTVPEHRQKEAQVLGFHLEGPYIDVGHKGAMAERFIRLPDYDEFSRLPNIRMVTMAPEKGGAVDFISRCGDIVVSFAHTNCTYTEAMSGFAAGGKCVTHLFNAMPPLHHREPGLIGAAISSDAYVQVIADGIHLHPSVVVAAYRIFGDRRMVLISDSMCATGVADGGYIFGGQAIEVKDGVARTENGNLAGSTSTLADCVRSAVRFGMPEESAVRMATETPAALMGLSDRGRLAVGCVADILFCKEGLDIQKVAIHNSQN